MLYKIANNLTPNYMVQMFDKHFGSKKYDLRTSNKDFSLPSCKTNYYRQSFAFTGQDKTRQDKTRQDKTRQDNIYSHFLFHRFTVTKK